jgi:hypothetical protein
MDAVLKRDGRSDEALRNRSQMSWRRRGGTRLGYSARWPHALPSAADPPHPSAARSEVERAVSPRRLMGGMIREADPHEPHSFDRLQVGCSVSNGRTATEEG